MPLGPHIVRYGTAGDQQHLVDDILNTYDELLINARMVAHMRAGLTSFLLHRARNKRYLIDPETHAFQHALEHIESTDDKGNTSIKRSIRSLAQAYGAPITTRVIEKSSPVLPSDFSDDAARRAFCNCVLSYEREALAQEATDAPAAKYYKYRALKDGGDTPNFQPAALIAPYFYLSATTLDDWLRVNQACARDSQVIAQQANLPLAVEVCISKEILMDPALVDRVVTAYHALDPAPDYFLLWIDDFAEHLTSESALLAFVDLVARLGQKAPVIDLFGGFFAVAAMRSGHLPTLAAVCHGLEYGEHRSVIPVGGGVPVSKFYFPSLHVRLVFRQALLVAEAMDALDARQAYLDKVCECAECQTVIHGVPREDFETYGRTRTVPPQGKRRRALEFPLPETKAHCVRHYMLAKHKEYNATPADAATVVRALRLTAAELRGRVNPMVIGHCDAWANVLSRIAGLPPDGGDQQPHAVQ